MDDRVRQVACGRSIVDDHVDDAGFGRRIGAGVVERDLPQCRLISGQRRVASKREDAGEGIVEGSRDAGRRGPVEHQNIVGVGVRQRDRRRGELDVVAVGYQDVGVHDGDGWAPVGERGQIVHAADRRAVRVEIERRRDVGNDVHEGRADIAVEGTVVDGDFDDAVSSGSARGAEDHLAQGCLVFCQGSRAGERENAGYRNRRPR